MVHVGWDLLLHCILGSYECINSLWRFVVEIVQFWFKIPLLAVGVNIFVCLQEFRFPTAFDWCAHDEVNIVHIKDVSIFHAVIGHMWKYPSLIAVIESVYIHH